MKIKWLINHKVRFDRGRVYYGYFMGYITAVMVTILGEYKQWWVWVITGALTFVIIYLFGLIDDVSGMFKNEQERYTDQNPILIKMAEDINHIKQKIDGKSTEETKL